MPLVAYRMAQEALTNVSKHAQASRVHIELAVGAGVLSLEVSDNGRGLSEDDRAKARSFGLRGLHERASTVGGWVDLSSGPGGTHLILSVPLTGVDETETGLETEDERRGRAPARPLGLDTAVRAHDRRHPLRRPRADPARHPRHLVRRAPTSTSSARPATTASCAR